MLGVPESDGDRFRVFIHRIMERPGHYAGSIAPEETMWFYLLQIVEQRRRERRDDLISFLLDAEIAGQPLSDDHVIGTCALLLIAGIDTTWSAIGASLFHLATHPEDRARLVADPALLPTAIEEFLRAYAPVTMARLVAQEVEVGGTTMHEGDWVLLSFPAANRDPAAFEDADRVLIDRARNRHAAFGLGIHRCLGSNLARLELTIAVDEWLGRFPDFELADPDAVRWATGQVRGPRELPVVIHGGH
jgi:cytochrome P450